MHFFCFQLVRKLSFERKVTRELLEGSVQFIMIISSIWEQDISLIVCLAVLQVEDLNI